MIPRCIHSKVWRPQIGLQFQWPNIAIRLSSKSSSSSPSSSDSSSDSDSDTEKKSQRNKPMKKIIHEATDKTINIDVLLQDMMKGGNVSKNVNVVVKPKAKKPKKPLEQQSYAHQLLAAANEVANKLGGDTQSVASQLLGRFEKNQLNDKIPPRHINNMVSNIKNKTVHKSDTTTKTWEKNKSVMQELLKKSKLEKPSKYINNRNQRLFQNKDKPSAIVMNLFPKIAEPSADIPELKTWNALQQKELDLSVTHTPRNVFQELIQWTEQGKIWKFPIDNEQGMEQEHSVHFSEHVFMERHLKDWCPKHGPVRHFMELVCVGLSKNPYLTVEEKLSHIAWYKQFFDDKKDILRELGAIETPSSDSVKQIESS